jgi:hypothetical protein
LFWFDQQSTHVRDAGGAGMNRGAWRVLGIAVAVCGCGNEFDIGGLAGDYLVNGDPGCVAHVSGMHLSLSCVEDHSSGSYIDRSTRTAEFDLAESTVSGTYATSWHQEDPYYGSVYEGTDTISVVASKTAGGSGGGSFGPFAGSWMVAGTEEVQSSYNGTPDFPYSSSIAMTVSVEGNVATFADMTGAWLATATMTGGMLNVTGNVGFFAVH